ncbi:MAG: class I SAM-dependent methyltransferase [Candidatus Acidiferrales bacterium]
MTLRYILWRLREEFWPEKHPYDILTGCDTSGMIHHRRLGSEASDYQPVDPDVFRATMAHVIGHINEHAGEHANQDVSEFTFVDLGCGKGRALLLAEEYEFRKIVGVDFSADLTRIASRNAEKVGATRITVVHGDVREFDFPAGPLVVLLYNPFSAQITRSVMQRLLSHPGTFYIAYVNPLHGHAVSSLPGAEIVAKDDWCAVWRFGGATPAGCVESGATISRARRMLR